MRNLTVVERLNLCNMPWRNKEGQWKMAITSESVRNFAVESCKQQDIADLTVEQEAALHHFRHKCLASLHRLYMTVPEARANQIVEKLLPTLLGG